MNVKTTVYKEMTWAQIKEAAESYTAPVPDEMLPSGSIIPVTLKSGEEIEIKVARDEGGKVYFTFRDCLNERHPWNKRMTNKGGWAASEIRRYANEDIFALLPDDLQEVIVPTTIVQVVDGERVETQDKLFLLSETQVVGACATSYIDPEDTQLDIFKNSGERGRVKNWKGETWYWPLRSPDPSGATNVRTVYDNGVLISNNASGSNGISLCFCVNR